MLPAEVQQQIATVEQRGEQQSEEPRDRERSSEKPCPQSTPDWGIVDIGIGTHTAALHRGDCWAAGKKLRPISRQEALCARTDGVTACEVCRPDTVLGAPREAARRTLET
ncbi:DUF6233 domain-containing protein [Streptomyces sp. NPDC058092]|uniref:DUF6233 domain-containing protein n=1 Tax=Streptomyces sp. NPDC058092 TaxID=3346336 RepID=UPI0036EE3109